MNPKAQISGFNKAKLIFILALMSAVAPLSTDMYLPALAHVKDSFNTNEFFTQLSLASFFIAFALGQLIYGPLSDIFGRKKPLVAGICLFMLASLGCVMVDNVAHFIALRFLEAIGGCAGVVVARAIINDLFDMPESGSIFALMMVVSSLAPMLSPTFGSTLLLFFSWQSIFVALFMLGIFLLFLIIFVLKESSPKREKFSQEKIISGYKIVFKNSSFLSYSLCASFSVGAIFAYITASNFVLSGHFGLSEQVYGAVFGINAFGLMIASMINAKLVLKIPAKTLLKAGVLAINLAGVLLIVAGYLDNFWLYEIMLFVCMGAIGFIAPNTTTLAMACFKEHAGTASAVLGTMQFALAGAISFGVSLLGANTPSLLSFSIFACALFSVLIYIFKIRKIAI